MPQDMQSKHVMELGPLNDSGFNHWILQSKQFYGPLADYVRSLAKSTSDGDLKRWRNVCRDIAFITGRIPRCLVTYIKEDMKDASAITDDDALNLRLSRNRNRVHRVLVDSVNDLYARFFRKRGVTDQFYATLHDLFFNRKTSAPRSFLGTGLVCYETRGLDTLLRFTTPAAAQVMWERWFPAVANQSSSPFVRNLKKYVKNYNNHGLNDSVRGNAFERALLSRLASVGKISLRHRRLVSATSSSTSGEMYTTMHITFTQCVTDPPSSYNTIRHGTLLTMPMQGEDQFDAVYYSGNVVVFLEATIGDCTSSAHGIVPGEDENRSRLEVILRKIKKWIGQELFDVRLDRHGHLRITHSLPKTRMMPEIPTVTYVICTTRAALTISTQREDMYEFIRLCDRTLLQTSGLFSFDGNVMAMCSTD